MLSRNRWPVGVCSWSLRSDIAGIAVAMKELGLQHIHLELGLALGKGGVDYLKEVRKHDWIITSGMIGFPQEDYATLDTIRRTGGIVPDAEWPANRRMFVEAAKIAADLGTPYLSMHAGFLDHTNAAYAAKFYDRIRTLADEAHALGLTLLMETGQESAADLKRFAEEMNHPALGINFDPANMLLYNKDDSCSVVRLLSPWVRHIHIKDATRSKTPGQWGKEVPWGDGEVRASEFMDTLEAVGFSGSLAIEREGGAKRMDDIRLAVARVQSR